MTNKEQRAMLAFIASHGYRVFHRLGSDVTYCFYTNGTDIGYAQWGGLVNTVSTVHVPCIECGTGFQVADEITPETLRAGFAIAPHWATGRDCAAVKKYRDWEAFQKARRATWGGGFVEFVSGEVAA